MRKGGVHMEKKSGHKRSNLIVFIVVMILVVAGGLVLYYRYMSKQQTEETAKTPSTEVEKLLAKDLETGYPETPTEVMKLWGRINQCMYNSKLTDEQFEALLGQLRMMYSTELLEQNPEESHLAKMQEEVSEFKSKKNKIVSYSAQTGTSVVYKSIQDRETSKARISYFINCSGTYLKQYQDYVLVDEDGKWKILGFKEISTEKSSSKKEATED
jgi:hypothetical protein